MIVVLVIFVFINSNTCIQCWVKQVTKLLVKKGKNSQILLLFCILQDFTYRGTFVNKVIF